MLRTTLKYVGRYGKEMKMSYMALHTNIPACTYWNGFFCTERRLLWLARPTPTGMVTSITVPAPCGTSPHHPALQGEDQRH